MVVDKVRHMSGIGKIIGIDLGTSNSAAAVIIGGRPTLIPAAEGTTVGGKAFPSVMALSKEGELLVGEPARRQAVTNPDNTVIEAKRKMGSSHEFRLLGKKFKPEQISAFILQKIKKDAEAFLGEPIKKVVVTVPAYFDDNQRQATKNAGTIAGLDVARIINEPTAASLALGFDKSTEDMKILVFDFGGGTLDVTVMEMSGGVFEVLSTSGNTQLGGSDMDKELIGHIINEFKNKEGVDLLPDATAMARIREAAEKAKIELSTVMKTDINLPFICHDSSSGTKNLEMELTRSKFDEMIMPIIDRCKPPILQAINDADLELDEIDKIVLVGGPTRIPLVRKFIGDVIGKAPESGIDPMEAVATGAAIQAAILSNNSSTDIVLLDVTPLSLGVKIEGGLVSKIIDRNTSIPVSKTRPYTTVTDNQESVTFRVIQGERPMASDNISLGTFTLPDIPPAPRGEPKLEVTFSINVDGVLDVTAKNTETEKMVNISIDSTKLSEADVEKLKNDAAKFFNIDKETYR